MNPPRPSTPVLAAAAVVALILAYDMQDRFRKEQPGENHYVVLASGIIDGKFELNPELVRKHKLHDLVERDGKYYLYAAPLPAFVFVPLVAAVGVDRASPLLVCCVATLINLRLAYVAFRRLGVDREVALWLTAGFLGGTAYWFCCVQPGVWYTAQVFAVTGMVAAFCEAAGKSRGWVMGLCMGLAILSRQASVLTLLFLVPLMWHVRREKPLANRLLHTIYGGVVLAGFLAAYLYVNSVCFGNPLSAGYDQVVVGSPTWRANIANHGIRNLKYIPFNLFELLFQGFHFDMHPDAPDTLKMDRNGTSITFATPWVFLAFRAVWNRRLALFAAAAVVLALFVHMTNYSNGWATTNAQRYTLDYFPVVMPFVAFGMMNTPRWLWKWAIGYSISLNFLALVVLPRAWSLLNKVFGTLPVGPILPGT